MAVLNLCSCGDKENALPPAAATTARGVAVKSHAARKRPGGKAARRRPPLRDITGLFLAAPSRAPPAALLALAEAELPVAVREARDGSSDGAAAKQGRYSLRKGFR